MREKASLARRTGIHDYRAWTTEELIEAYLFEAKRGNREDAVNSRCVIKGEIKRRFSETLKALDDERLFDKPTVIYRSLLHVSE